MSTLTSRRTAEAARLRIFIPVIVSGILLLAGFVVVLPGFTDSGAPQAPPSAIQQTSVLTVSKAEVLVRILSPDRRHVATAVQRKPSSLLGGLFRLPGPQVVIGSPSRKPFHAVNLQAGTTYQVFTDGRGDSVVSKICGFCIAFSPDSRHLAYAACRDELPPPGAAYAQPSTKWGIVYDGVTTQTFEDVGTPAFSPDGRHFAHVAISADSSFLVMDGVPQASVGTSGSQTVTFSPDGGRVAYVASAMGNQFVVTDGQPGPGFPLVADLTLCFSPDGSRLAYVAGANARGTRCFVVVDGSSGPECDGVVPAWVNPESSSMGRQDYVTGITFSADSRHIAYAMVDGEKWFMVIDGQPGPPYEAVIPPRFHGTDSLPTYAVQKERKWFLIRNGVPDAERYDALQYNPTTGPIGGHWAYAIREGKQWSMIVDGRRDPVVDELWVMDMVFSVDGAHCAYPARAGGKEFIVVDGVAGPRWDGVSSICFSPDGRRTAYVARKGKKEFVLLDGMAGPMTDGVLRNGVSFDPDGQAIEYFTLKDKTLWRIRQAVVPSPHGV